MGYKLDSIMKVMRFANGRSRPGYDLFSIIPKDVTKLQGYDIQKRALSREKDNNMAFDLTSMIPVCFFEDFNEYNHKDRGYSKYSCQHFQPVITDMGICHAFNPTPIPDLLQKSYFTESFYEAFQYDMIFNATTIYGTEFGDSFNFYLLGNQRLRHTGHGKGIMNVDLEEAKFLFGLSNADEYFNIKASSKVISAGHKITWSVQAMEIVPSESMEDISIDSRQCRLPHETEGLKIFKSYSKPGCEFEARLRKAEEACKCVPWDIPYDSYESYPICDIYGNYCFKNIWKKYQKSIKECLPGCHQLKFTSSEVREKLDPEKICREDGNRHFRHLIATLWTRGGMGRFFEIQKIKELIANGNARKVAYNSTQAKVEFCMSVVENDLAEVSVMFERPEFIRTSTSKRVSFPDQLGVFGKNIFGHYSNKTFKTYFFRWNPGFVHWNEYS